MTKDFGGQEDIEELPYSAASSSSRMELKRSRHQWLTEQPSGSLLFGNKKRQGAPSAWDNSLVPSHLTNCCLFDPANNALHTSHLLGQQHIEDEHSNHVLSIGTTLNLGSIRKVKINQISESGNIPDLYGGISTSFETGPSHDSTLSFGQTCGNIDKSFIFPGGKVDGNFIRNFNNEGVGVIPMRDFYEKADGNVSSTFHPSEKGVDNFVLMGQSLQKADCNIFSMTSSYTKGQENFMSLLSCDRVPENIFMTESNYCKENANVLSAGQSLYTQGADMSSMVSSQERAETTLGSSARVINSYDNFSHDPATPLHVEAEENMSSEFGNPFYASPRVDTLLVPKSKDLKTSKKVSTNTFPSNVKSLLSTGMFDGVTVKYYSWSREKNLRGIIKGTGYLCGCGNCNFNKVLNAYEFEQHANCKTKHPNNHIYFENGKTIYGVVQELKNSPQEKLFDAIQTITGSDINHKNFNIWKASYQVASLELKRIYGKDAVTLAS